MCRHALYEDKEDDDEYVGRSYHRFQLRYMAKMRQTASTSTSSTSSTEEKEADDDDDDEDEDDEDDEDDTDDEEGPGEHLYEAPCQLSKEGEEFASLADQTLEVRLFDYKHLTRNKSP